MKRWIFGALAILLAAATGAWIYSRDTGAAPRQVRTATVDTGPVESPLRVTGTVRSERPLLVSAASAGRVQSVAVETGAEATAGQVLVRLDTAAAEAELGASKATLQQSELEIARRERQLADLRVDVKAGAEARSALEEAQAQLAAEQARRDKVLADVRLAQLRLQEQAVKAGSAGLVTAVEVSAGEFVQPGRVLVRMVRPADLKVLAKLEPADAPLVKIGMQAQVEDEGSGRPARSARVTRIEPAVTREGSNAYLGIWLDFDDGKPAGRLNQQVDVLFRTGSTAPVLRVPVAAIVTRAGRDSVWILQGGRLALRPVVTGAFGEHVAEVVSGLAAGDAVVMPEGDAVLKEGERAVPAAPAASR